MEPEDLGGVYSAPGANLNGETEARTAPGSSPGVAICYRIHGCGSTKLLLIPGLACGHGFWGAYARELTRNYNISNALKGASGSWEEEDGIQICSFDNRGVGGSSIPENKTEYTTTIMAKDALALMDFLNWKEAHICGHSMGAMIGFKVAALAPNRVLSLTLISVTGGGIQCLPKFGWRSCSIAYRFLRAQTLEQRILVDLDTHYTQDYMNELVDNETRKALLFKEYVKNMEIGGVQPKPGLNGHLHACWSHEATDSEIQKIRSAGFLVAVIHGKHDVIAQIRHARKLAQKLRSSARMFELSGGHLVTHQNTQEVLQIMLDVIQASSGNLRPCSWDRECPEQDDISPATGFWGMIRSCLCLLAIFSSWLLIWLKF